MNSLMFTRDTNESNIEDSQIFGFVDSHKK